MCTRNPMMVLSLVLLVGTVCVAGQAWCPQLDGKCVWHDTMPEGTKCWTSEARCNAESGKCTGNWGTSWLCIQDCQSAGGQCYAVAKCILGHQNFAPCALAQDQMAGNCDGTLLPLSIPPQSFSPGDKTCEEQAKAARIGRTGCPSTMLEVGVNSSVALLPQPNADVTDDDHCNPDPDGSKHTCFNECRQCYSDGAEEYCAPSAQNGTCRNICEDLWSEDDCNSVCSCKLAPPPGKTCPTPLDKNWGQCTDPSKGGSENCVWCQKDHKCEPTDGKHFPLGYDPACGDPSLAIKSSMYLPEVSSQNLCTFACDDGSSLFRCLLDSCPDTYSGCKRADSYVVSSDSCSHLSIYMYKSGGAMVHDREAGHKSVASNAMISVAKKIREERSHLLSMGVDLGPVSPDDIAKGISDLEGKGLDMFENSLCSSATSGAATQFCGFIVQTPVVQWVNQKIVNLPVVAQVTHQIATLAAGAVAKVADLVQNAVQQVSQAVMGPVKQLVDTCANAATSIVHAVLNFFSWVERSIYATVTGERGQLPLPPALRTRDRVTCWMCPCGSMGCGGSCVLDSRRSLDGSFCVNGAFVEDADDPEPDTCNKYCQSNVEVVV